MAKIRTDYVSNSSSSSFALIGQAIDEEELANAYKRVFGEEMGEEMDSYDAADKLASKLGLVFEHGIENYYDMWAFGLHFDDMNLTETKAEFIARISNALKPALLDVDVKELVDGGQDE